MNINVLLAIRQLIFRTIFPCLLFNPPEKIIDRNDDQIGHRDYKNFNTDAFKRDIDEIDCSLATRNTDVNLGFEIFLRLIEIILDKHAPLKKGSRKKDKKSLTPRSRGE